MATSSQQQIAFPAEAFDRLRRMRENWNYPAIYGKWTSDQPEPEAADRIALADWALAAVPAMRERNNELLTHGYDSDLIRAILADLGEPLP